MKKDMLYDILMQENVIESINNNLDVVLDLIPEVRGMIDFPHNHPHHHLDVWNHTLLALSYSPYNFDIRLVLLLHDIGKPYSYQDAEIRHFKGHPLVSFLMSKNILERLGFSFDDISRLCYLIKEHDSLITDREIINDIDLARIKFNVQCCDALAHNPLKLEKRIKYLLNINEKLNDDKEKEKCKKLVSKFF